MTEIKKRGRGRPRKADSERRRKTVNVHMVDDLHQRIEQTASANAVSMSHEIMQRIERTYRAEEEGRRALLSLVIDNHRTDQFGLLAQFVRTVTEIEARTKKSWAKDDDTREQVFSAFVTLLNLNCGASAGVWPEPSSENFAAGYRAALVEQNESIKHLRVERTAIFEICSQLSREIEHRETTWRAAITGSPDTGGPKSDRRSSTKGKER